MGLGHGGRERKERNEGEAEEVGLGKDQAGVASPGGEAGRERTGGGPKQPTIGPFPTPEHHSGRGRGLPCLHCLRQERKEQLQEEERNQPWYQDKAWALAKVTHRVDLLGRGGHDTTYAVARQGSLVNDIYVGRGVYVGRIGTGKFAGGGLRGRMQSYGARLAVADQDVSDDAADPKDTRETVDAGQVGEPDPLAAPGGVRMGRSDAGEREGKTGYNYPCHYRCLYSAGGHRRRAGTARLHAIGKLARPLLALWSGAGSTSGSGEEHEEEEHKGEEQEEEGEEEEAHCRTIRDYWRNWRSPADPYQAARWRFRSGEEKGQEGYQDYPSVSSAYPRWGRWSRPNSLRSQGSESSSGQGGSAGSHQSSGTAQAHRAQQAPQGAARDHKGRWTIHTRQVRRRPRPRPKAGALGRGGPFRVAVLFAVAAAAISILARVVGAAPDVGAALPAGGERFEMNPQRTLLGYDCGSPSTVQTISSVASGVEDCDKDLKSPPPKNVTKIMNAIQMARNRRVSVQVLRIINYRIAHSCWREYTNSDAWITDEARFHEDVYISAEQAKQVWKTGVWQARSGNDGDCDVERNGTSYCWIRRVGHDEVEDEGMMCYGEHHRLRTNWHKNTHIDSAKVTDYYRIDASTEWGVVDDEGRVRLEQSQVYLPEECKAEEGECRLNRHGMLIWKPPPPEPVCPYYQARKIKGHEITSQDGEDRFFVATDGALFRVKIEEPLSLCGTVGYATNFPEIFVTEDMNNKLLQRKIHPSEMSSAIMGKVKDQYFNEGMIEAVETAFRNLRTERCRTREQANEFAYARRMSEQMAMTDGTTVHLGKGRYVTSSGEVLHTYQCKPVHVLAMDSNTCYDSLPIMLSQADRKHYLASRGIFDRGSEMQFFLEPHSRKIKIDGMAMSCVSPFPSLYQNINGDWLEATPGIKAAAAPIMVKMNDQTIVKLFDRDFDYNAGSIYNPDDVAAMESYAKAGSSSQGLAAALNRRYSESIANMGGGGYTPNPNRIFPTLPSADFSWMDHFGWLWSGFKWYGDICSIVLASYLLWKVFTSILAFFLRWFRQPVTGKLMHLLTACLPSLGEFMRDPFRLGLAKRTVKKMLGDTDEEKGPAPERRRRRSNRDTLIEMAHRRSMIGPDARSEAGSITSATATAAADDYHKSLYPVARV